MSALTYENSFKSTNADMGSNHTETHKHDEGYRLGNEPKVIELTDTELTDDSLQLAKRKAIEQGVRSENNWKKYNAKLRKSRQKASYADYLEGLAGRTIKGKERAAKNPKMPESKKTSIYQELAAIHRNGGIPIDGSLIYLGNVSDYENLDKNELKRYRKWEIDTLTAFYHSDTFQKLNPGLFRAELHLDEKGRIHLQTQAVHYEKSKNGRVTYAKRKQVKNALVDVLGSEKEVNNKLDWLCYVHDVIYDGYNTGAFFIKGKDNDVWDRKFDKKRVYSQAEKRSRLTELARIIQERELYQIARQKARQRKIEWNINNHLTTDGRHKTASQYATEVKSALHANHAKKQVEKAQSELNELSEEKANFKKDIDNEMEAYRVAQKAKIDKELRDEKQEKLRKLRQREDELKSNEEALNNQLAMFPTVNKWLKSSNQHEFSIISPDVHHVADMMKTDINRQAEKAREYDTLLERHRRLQKAFKTIYEELYKKPLKSFKQAVSSVLHPKIKDVKEKQPKPLAKTKKLAKSEQEFANRQANDILSKIMPTPSAEAYEREAQTVSNSPSINKDRQF